MEDTYIYILTNKNNTVLYVGSTSSLRERVYHHRNRLISGLSRKFNLNKLVYYEACENSISSRKREVQIKKGSRKAKVILIDKINPDWNDLYDQLE